MQPGCHLFECRTASHSNGAYDIIFAEVDIERTRQFTCLFKIFQEVVTFAELAEKSCFFYTCATYFLFAQVFFYI